MPKRKRRTKGVAPRLKALERLRNSKRPKSKLEMLCIHRQIHDLENEGKNGLHWDEDEAQRCVAFFKLLYHWKGDMAGTRFDPEPFQEQLIIAPIFGWQRDCKGGLKRRFSVGYCEIPRKNGKTFLASGFANQGLLADGENAPEVYSAATQREQASLVFRDAQKSVRPSPQLSGYVEHWRNSSTCPQNNGVLQPLTSDYNFLQGKNPSRVLIDELHAHKTREVWDALLSGMGARPNPLLFAITTAGHDRSTICWEQHEFARQILEGHFDEPTYFAFLAAADPDDDPFEPVIWHKANPNLGVSVQEDFLATEARKAQRSPSYENTFRRLYLNQWTEQSVRWIPMSAWDACNQPIELEELQHRKCYAGLDLASTRDVNAFVLCFPLDGGNYAFLPFFWSPEDPHDDRAAQDRRQVKHWAEQGHITLTPGNVADVDGMIPDEIADICNRFNVVDIAFDPWGPAPALVQKLTSKGVPFEVWTEFRQSTANFASPCKQFERLVLSGKVVHGQNPVLRWMASNMTIKEDAAGNMRPDKQKSSEKIDGIVAAIMALGRAIAAEESPTPTYYESHEMEIV